MAATTVAALSLKVYQNKRMYLITLAKSGEQYVILSDS